MQGKLRLDWMETDTERVRCQPSARGTRPDLRRCQRRQLRLGCQIPEKIRHNFSMAPRGALLAAMGCPAWASPSIARARSGAILPPHFSRSRKLVIGGPLSDIPFASLRGEPLLGGHGARSGAAVHGLHLHGHGAAGHPDALGLARQPRDARAEELPVRPDLRRIEARRRLSQAGARGRNGARHRPGGARGVAQGRAGVRQLPVRIGLGQSAAGRHPPRPAASRVGGGQRRRRPDSLPLCNAGT